MSTNTSIEEKNKEIAQRIVELTGYGQALHINDILPDIREAANFAAEHLQKEAVEGERERVKKTLFELHDKADNAKDRVYVMSVIGMINKIN